MSPPTSLPVRVTEQFRHLAARAKVRPPVLLAALVAVTVLAAGLTFVAVVPDDDLRAGEARLRPQGEVEVSLDGVRFVSVTEEMLLAEGDRVRVLSGSATLDLPAGGVAELREGSGLAVGSATGPDLVLEAGDLLVVVQRDTVDVEGGSALVAVGAGAAKLRRSASLVAGVYEGNLLLAGTAQSLAVPPLRQASVAGTGRIPETARPLSIDDEDPWDRRFLGGVLELDRRLVAFGRGFEALVPPESATSPSFFRQVLPDLGPAPLTSALLALRSAGENLIGLSLVAMSSAPFEDAVERIFGLRDAGARWGLVAADEGLTSEEVMGTVESAIDRAPLPLGTPDGVAGPPTGTTPGPTGPSPSPTGPSPTGPGPAGPDGTTTTTAPNGTTTTTALDLLPPPTLGPTTTTTTTTPSDDCPGLLGSFLCL